MTWFDRPVLADSLVRLVPLSPDHAEGLFAAGHDPGVWTWLSGPPPGSVEEVRAGIVAALAQPDRAAWTQFDAAGVIAGTTSYYDIDPANRGLYIGHTWLGTAWQRTGLNTQAKSLLVRRAFEELGAIRVGWHTHARNARSRAAIERLGARFEGIMRNHKILHNGTVRDTALYSMTDTEWPATPLNTRGSVID
ncbi:MAG: GNAT family protein [Streptosporangiaceae bacterium]